MFSLHRLTSDLIGVLMHIFSQKAVAVFFVMVAADAANQGCEEQQRTIDRMLCISRGMFSLLIPVLSLAGSFCAVIPVLHDSSLSNLLVAAISLLICCHCTRLGHSRQR
jgi:hypothetical protein